MGTTQTWPPKTALVVGGASGMGAALATKLLALGTKVLVAGRSKTRLNTWLEHNPGNALATQCDLSSDESVVALLDTAKAELGELDLVVITPGKAVLGPIDEVPVDAWQDAINLNLFGLVRIVNGVVPAMRKRGQGQLMLTGSEAGYRPQSWALGVYGTTKAAVNAYAENLAVYCRGHGVQVSLWCPGVVDTNMGESAVFVGVTDYAAWGTLGPDPRQISSEEAAQAAIEGLSEGKFFIPTHPEFLAELKARGENLDDALFSRADKEGPSPI